MLRADDEVGVERARRGRIRRLAVELLEERRSEVQRASGSTGSRPRRSRPNAARADGRERRQRAGLLGGRRPGQLLRRAPDRDGGAQGIHWGGVARQLPQRA